MIAGFGRRDAPSDGRFPLVIGRRNMDGTTTDLPGIEVFQLNDQHAFVRVPASCNLAPGDVLRFGISLPCGAFDRWRSMPIVSDDDAIIGAASPRH